MKFPISSLLAAAFTLPLAGVAQAQATVKTDGQWRYALGAGANLSAGNSDSKNFNLNGEGVRATPQDKWSLNARALYGRTDGVSTAELFGAGARYDRGFAPQWFGFGTGEVLRDRPANLSRRLSAGTGIGYHVMATDPARFDVFGGLGYSDDTFTEARVVADELRTRYGRAELLLGAESTHRISPSTSFKQRLVAYPNLKDRGEMRATYDAGLAVAINKGLSLTVALGHRYNSDPGTGLKTGDTVLLTGVSAKFD